MRVNHVPSFLYAVIIQEGWYKTIRSTQRGVMQYKMYANIKMYITHCDVMFNNTHDKLRLKVTHWLEHICFVINTTDNKEIPQEA